jgi:hypothetical protein
MMDVNDGVAKSSFFSRASALPLATGIFGDSPICVLKMAEVSSVLAMQMKCLKPANYRQVSQFLASTAALRVQNTCALATMVQYFGTIFLTREKRSKTTAWSFIHELL